MRIGGYKVIVNEYKVVLDTTAKWWELRLGWSEGGGGRARAGHLSSAVLAMNLIEQRTDAGVVAADFCRK